MRVRLFDDSSAVMTMAATMSERGIEGICMRRWGEGELNNVESSDPNVRCFTWRRRYPERPLQRSPENIRGMVSEVLVHESSLNENERRFLNDVEQRQLHAKLNINQRAWIEKIWERTTGGGSAGHTHTRRRS